MNKPISEKICELRKARKLTQEQLGESLGVSGQAVSKWETGASMPDILLLPRLCDVLGVSVGALLEVPAPLKQKNTVADFCQYARETGRGAAVLDVIARLFNDVGNKNGGVNAFFSSSGIRVSDDRGMGFVTVGKEYLPKCYEMKSEDIARFLEVLTDEVSFSVLKMTSMDNAVTEKEIAEALSLDEATVDKALLELMKRNIIATGIDDRGKRGYLQSANMVGIAMVLAGCSLAACGGEGMGSYWLSRE